MWNYAHIFSQTLAHGTRNSEMRQRNRRNKHKKVKMEESKVAQKNRPELTIARPTVPQGLLLPKVVDKLPNKPNL